MISWRFWRSCALYDDGWPGQDYDESELEHCCHQLGGRVQSRDLWIDFWIPEDRLAFWLLRYPDLIALM